MKPIHLPQLEVLSAIYYKGQSYYIVVKRKDFGLETSLDYEQNNTTSKL